MIQFNMDAHIRNQMRLSRALVNRGFFMPLKIEKFEPEWIETNDTYVSEGEQDE